MQVCVKKYYKFYTSLIIVQSKTVRGLNWNQASIGNATWTGVRLRDVLLSVGVTAKQKFKHVQVKTTRGVYPFLFLICWRLQFEGLDLDVSGNPYGGSIAFNKAMDPQGDVLLAFEMNGEPLPRDHGFPVRVIAPGIVGARNVKWLGKIVLSNEESQAFWQQKDYKGFSPSVDASNADYSKAPSIQQLPVISAICTPNNGETVDVKDGFVTVRGRTGPIGASPVFAMLAMNCCRLRVVWGRAEDSEGRSDVGRR